MNSCHTASHRIICWRFTLKCNRNCEFCISRSGPDYGNPHWDLDSVINRLTELGVEKISYTGGEPLLHPELPVAVKKVKNLGIQQVLASNGDVLKDRTIRWLADIQYTKLSFLGAEFVHDKIMGKGHYRMLLSIALKEARRGISIGANYMLSKRSLDGIPVFLRDALDSSIQNVLLLTYIPIKSKYINSIYGLGPLKELLPILRNRISDIAKCFPGGVKVHDYSIYDFFVVLDEAARFLLPRNGTTSPFLMGGLYDEELILPCGKNLDSSQALEMVWQTRKSTKAIISI